MIHSDIPDAGLFSSSLWKKIELFLAEARGSWPQNSVPYIHGARGYEYITFAGLTINRALALHSGFSDNEFNADDWSVTTPRMIEWKDLPDSPEGFSRIFRKLFELSRQQTIYQAMLPLDLQQTEFLQGWFVFNAVILYHLIVQN